MSQKKGLLVIGFMIVCWNLSASQLWCPAGSHEAMRQVANGGTLAFVGTTKLKAYDTTRRQAGQEMVNSLKHQLEVCKNRPETSSFSTAHEVTYQNGDANSACKVSGSKLWVCEEHVQQEWICCVS